MIKIKVSAGSSCKIDNVNEGLKVFGPALIIVIKGEDLENGETTAGTVAPITFKVNSEISPEEIMKKILLGQQKESSGVSRV